MHIVVLKFLLRVLRVKSSMWLPFCVRVSILLEAGATAAANFVFPAISFSK